MARFTTPVLTITGSTPPGFSDVEVQYTVTFDKRDTASDLPYSESVNLIGDDAGGVNDLLFGMVPGLSSPSIIRASDIVAPATTLPRTHRKPLLSNTTLDEDQPPAQNPDEIRAVVTLTPVPPVTSGPIESNLVTLTLP